jgi:hypothetical protein
MFKQNTRLELVIVGAALLVLFLCRQPPKSGNAQVAGDGGRPAPAKTMPAGETPMPAVSRPDLDDPGRRTPSPALSPASAPPRELQALQPSSTVMTSDNRVTRPVEPPSTSLWMVDARRCNDLKYTDVMYGKLTVQWSWDGQKVVPRKVIEVREADGSTSIWGFDEREDIILTEIPQ